MKDVDLLKLADEAEAKAREAGVERAPKDLVKLPESFAASGVNTSVSFDEIRVLGGDEEPA